MNTALSTLKLFQQARNRGKILTPDDVAKGTGLNVHTVYAILARLARSGDLEKVGRGQYKLTPRAETKGAEFAQMHDDGPVDGATLFAEGEGVAVEADVIELVITERNGTRILLCAALWMMAVKWPNRLVPDGEVIEVAFEDGYSLHDVMHALALLGTEPVVEGELNFTKFPRGKLILTLE